MGEVELKSVVVVIEFLVEVDGIVVDIGIKDTKDIDRKIYNPIEEVGVDMDEKEEWHIGEDKTMEWT